MTSQQLKMHCVITTRRSYDLLDFFREWKTGWSKTMQKHFQVDDTTTWIRPVDFEVSKNKVIATNP